MAKAQKTAVVLFNLGGPTNPESVKPFLFNLFNDKAIIRLPQPLRFLLAKFISARRAPVAKEIYDQIGGASPLLKNTEKQARALEWVLGKNYKCFVAMRYWHPFADEAAVKVKDFAPDKVILLPLYPQFSTTTTASSLKDWAKAAKGAGVSVPTAHIDSYPANKSLVAAHVSALKPFLKDSGGASATRILFSAHGLPEKIVKDGDPYPHQVEQTAAAVVRALKGFKLDHVVCYQSRVGPMKWIGPSTEDEIIRAGAEGKGLIVVPISFVSEHSETLVELDIEYKALATSNNVKHYARVPALGTAKDFITCLANLVKGATTNEEKT